MSAEPDDRDDPWAEVLDCVVCGAENALIEGWYLGQEGGTGAAVVLAASFPETE